MKKDIFTFLDTETTDLVKPIGTALELQPHIIEICAIQTDHKYNVLNVFDTLVKPPIEIPYFITKHTGITQKMVDGAPKFKDIFKAFKAAIKPSTVFVAQNLRFDQSMIEFEAMRLKKKIKLPKKRFCTVEQSMHFQGYRLKSTELYFLATGKEIKGIHRARMDVKAMIEYYKFIIKNKPEHLK